MSRGDHAPHWLGEDGRPIACVEKIKVLQENYDELRQLAQEMFDDALLMGCDADGVRAALHRLVDALSASFSR
jgi:hypothetical protein